VSSGRRAIGAFFALALVSQPVTTAPARAQVTQPTLGAPAPAETETAKAERCDRYARKQVESREPGAVGGAARGAVGGAILGAIIGGSDGAATGAAAGATAGALGGAPSTEETRAYQTFFGACMRTK
jgi:uncharacterized protein YcfJ